VKAAAVEMNLDRSLIQKGEAAAVEMNLDRSLIQKARPRRSR
jgi:hypothetical protein